MNNNYSKIIALCTLALCTGCEAMIRTIVGTLPPPDPIWSKAVAWKSSGSIWGEPSDILTANDRVKNYLTKYLPSPPEKLEAALKKDGLVCDKTRSIYATQMECWYSKSQPPVPCAVTYRVSIAVSFPVAVQEVNDVYVNTAVTKDLENHDDRGCFPL